MNEHRFVEQRTPRWRELGDLIERAQQRGLQRLAGAEVRRLGALYRLATGDLATARTLRCSDDTILHVNRLCATAHDLVYSSQRRTPAGAIVASMTTDFPRLVRSTLAWHVAAAAICLLAGVAGFIVFREDPDLADRTLGPIFRQRAERAAAMPGDARRYFEMRGAFAPFLSWGLIANNVTVSLIAFALGAGTVGLGVVVLVVNGVMLGGGFAVFADVGVPGVLATFIVGHGPLELTAIWIAAGAGLRVGVSWMLPGRRTRVGAFQQAGRDAITLLLGTTLMLVAAGIIEGFFSPTGLPAAVKVAVGATTAAGFAAYVAFGGRAEN